MSANQQGMETLQDFVLSRLTLPSHPQSIDVPAAELVENVMCVPCPCTCSRLISNDAIDATILPTIVPIQTEFDYWFFVCSMMAQLGPCYKPSFVVSTGDNFVSYAPCHVAAVLMHMNCSLSAQCRNLCAMWFISTCGFPLTGFGSPLQCVAAHAACCSPCQTCLSLCSSLQQQATLCMV